MRVTLADLYVRYHQEVQFLLIYIREAHPTDGWWLGGRLTAPLVQRFAPKAALNVADPGTIEERRAVAAQCETALQYGIRTYVDEMDDRVCKAYNAKPTRLFLVGVDGRVVYRGGPGPYGFKPAELETAIRRYLQALQNENRDLT
ncbi:MAG: hypothetical protein Fur0018_09400 [Anaerolineales bacterium]